MRVPRHMIKNSKALMIAPIIIACLLGLVYQLKWQKNQQALYGKSTAIERIPCMHCHEKGLILSDSAPNGYTFCPYCFGVGGHYIRRLNDADVLCPACAGLGRIEDPQTHQIRTCKRCDGRGLIQAQQQE